MILVRQIKLAILDDNELELKKKIAKKCNIKIDDIISYKISKKSIDARKKDDICYVYEVKVNIKNEDRVLVNNKSNDILKSVDEKYSFEITGLKKMKNRPIIVGSGPAGLFAGLLLAENGYRPIIIERGENINDRVNSVSKFWNDGVLNLNSNVQFGEGGAGTFSDGKLNTMVKDSKNRGKKVFETFVECGAPDDILYLSKPHIGTDLLRKVIINLREEIISLGGAFYYNTCLTDIVVKNNKIEKVILNDSKEMNCDVLVLAIGHSARDTFKMLLERKIEMSSKPFAVGFRVQHPQTLINEIQYGKKYAKELPPTSYKLTYNDLKNKKGVYSFCMCPGGYVVNASSEKNMLAINGMSNHNRDSGNANSAIVINVDRNDFGDGVLAGMEFQRYLEAKAYKLGAGRIPIQLLGDFINNRVSTTFGEVKPMFKGNYQFADLNELLSDKLNDIIKDAFRYFDKKMNGYLMNDAILAGIESRTSSPVTIKRNELGVSNIDGIYPCGEGCGYAGGITTASMDGIKVAEFIAKIYKNIDNMD